MNKDRAEHDNHGSTTGAPDGTVPPASSESAIVEKERTESPGSERETRAKQEQDLPEHPPGVSGSATVKTVPGTGGPDDVGDVEVDPGEVSLNGKPFPGHAGTK
ncbi:hypothetical protein [Rathayibacter toxicus]|uniref:Uncharacterized protein n=1 Tax=Rathayibacter toxicus TaxID=145458 RepID=A0A2S5Y893_9MICO|nr:hypothetical protein [Rathayibacter toxicus]PPH24694.1 hypothetical protein C5D17_01520 [Rathayibacter toxicus]PPH58620.1 hypothetical protein C5D30_01530 [Rathayibacter toxicus]PPH60611.1 hypothetical protein C5C93_01555 [Rathayibacter toxicus]PPH88431.1 hypothetical protein C5D31_01530 [Rathayibacter toxicus]PPI16125.1 hypothetical protein C5C51_01525 [Rathayibacter toxicus]